MEIKYHGIVLRDMEERDIRDEIRWNTVETEWALWDAPWEMEEELSRFDPEEHRRKELEWIAKPKPDRRLSLEIDTAGGTHVGSVSAYCIDKNFDWRKLSAGEDRSKVRWAVGIEINEPAFWSGGWGTQALTAWVKYHLEEGCAGLYAQTWSGNIRMVGLAEKLGFRECCRKAGIRQVRGGIYDGLTFRLDRDAFAAHCRRLEEAALELYIPRPEDMWFTRQMQEDPATMAYNAGWDVSFPGYHPDTGCIELPPEQWEKKRAWLVGHEPERFYAFIREVSTGAFVGEVNFHDYGQGMGVLLYAPYRGRGYGRPALELLLHRAFADCGLPELRNSFEPGRDAGLAVHLAAGFRQAGVSSALRFGQPVKLTELVLTREQYLARQKG